MIRLLRRSFLAAVVALAGAAPAQTPAQPPPAATAPSAVSRVDSVGITVSDLTRALNFYTGVFPFQEVSRAETAGDALEHLTGVFGARCVTVRLRLGEELIELTQYLAPEGRPFPADSRSNDRWFQHIAIVVSDMDRAYAHLRAHNIRHASSGPQTLPVWNTAAAGISAFYFKDPDGHYLEIIHFPPGKGDPRWQSSDGRLFLGVDHTAIVVADTDRSLAFYRDTLGMKVAGGSENFGKEQEHLNNVFGARLRITTLRAPAGPGVELLEYLAPTGGREFPPDTHSNDILHWHTTLVTPALDSLVDVLRESRTTWVSPGAIEGVFSVADLSQAAQIRDPDGHAVIVGQASPKPAASSRAARPAPE